jgi:putative phosphoribosyl transferase
MYFKNRAEAGRALAKQLEKYKSQHIVVLALGVGSSIVAAQVAMKLHSNLMLYVIKNINFPGENEMLAGLGSGDVFAYNSAFSTGEIDEYAQEYRSYIEQERMAKSHEIHMLLGKDGEIDKNLLRHRVVLLIVDGLANGASLDIAADFLKHIAIKKLVIATPIASVSAVDRMHLVGDDICCLNVADNFLGTNHYYDDNTIPDVPGIMKIMHNIALNWEDPTSPSAYHALPGQATADPMDPMHGRWFKRSNAFGGTPRRGTIY